MAFKIEQMVPYSTARYPYNCRVTFGQEVDVYTARAWTEECQVPCVWVGYTLYIGDRYTDFLALRYANAAYN
jgi:hypothetical protein